MKHRLILSVLTLLLLSAGQSLAAERTVTLRVDNMYCASCPFIVQMTLERVDGVTDVKVSFRERAARVTFDDAKTTVKILREATLLRGYPSAVLKYGS